MNRFISKSLFSLIFASAFLMFSSAAFADISEQAEAILNSPAAKCAKEAAPEVKSLIQNEIKNARNACADLRGCKKAARADKKQCKNGCKGLKGKAKRQCKKACRKEKRNAKKSCREAYKTPACKSARRKVFGKTFKAVMKLIKNKECREAINNLQELK